MQSLPATTNKSRWTLDPRYIPGCVLWYDARDSNTLSVDGGLVTLWRDKSATQAHVFQNTISQKPSYVTNAMNTYPVVRFNRTASNRLDGSLNSVSLGVTPLTYFMVEQNLSASTGGASIFCISGTSGIQITQSNAGMSPPYPSSAVVYTSTTPRIHSYYIRNTSNGGGQQFATSNDAYMMGQRFVGQNITFAARVGTPVFGRQQNGTLYSSGDIAEILLYNRELSNVERQAIEGYLKQKWGITNTLSQESRLFDTIPPYMNAFGPNVHLSMTLWYDSYNPASLSLSGGNIVSAWRDSMRVYSNTSANLVQLTDSNAPVYQYDSAYGVSGIFFSNAGGVANYLVPATLSFYWVNAPSYSIAMAYRFTVSTGPSQTVYRKLSGNPSSFSEFYIISGNTISCTMNEATLSYTKTDLSMTILTITAGAVNPTALVAYEEGGIQRYSANRSSTSNHNFNFGVGGASNVSGMTGYIYEMMVFNYILTPMERTGVESYLINKWNAKSSISSNSPYFLNPGANVIGTQLSNISYVRIQGNQNGDNWYNLTEVLFRDMSGNNISYSISFVPAPGATLPPRFGRLSNQVYLPPSSTTVTETTNTVNVSLDFMTDGNLRTGSYWNGGNFGTISYVQLNFRSNTTLKDIFILNSLSNLQYRMFNMVVTCHDNSNNIIDRVICREPYWTRASNDGFLLTLRRYNY
jgi:hypothetical protein